nr:MAG TPA: hypothetical protein [Caudoviricetes sp.]
MFDITRFHPHIFHFHFQHSVEDKCGSLNRQKIKRGGNRSPAKIKTSKNYLP